MINRWIPIVKKRTWPYEQILEYNELVTWQWNENDDGHKWMIDDIHLMKKKTFTWHFWNELNGHSDI